MGRYKTERQLSFVQGVLPGPNARIVDVGGGGGRLAIPLADAGHDVIVLDISAEALELRRQRTADAVAVHCCELMSYEPKTTYEVALLVDTVKCLSDLGLANVFAKVRSWLEPGVNSGSWRNKLSERLGRRRDGRR